MGLRKYKRWSAKRKEEVALDLLKGGPLEDLNRLTAPRTCSQELARGVFSRQRFTL